MGTKVNAAANEVFARWRAEDEDLGIQVDNIRQWMHELDQLGIQHFGETATRLKGLRGSMVEHFDREEEMITELGKHYRPSSPELSAVRSRADRDHELLLQRVEDFVTRLEQLEPPFDSWQQAIDEVEALVSVLEQHEATEWESIEMLLPA